MAAKQDLEDIRELAGEMLDILRYRDKDFIDSEEKAYLRLTLTSDSKQGLITEYQTRLATLKAKAKGL